MVVEVAGEAKADQAAVVLPHRLAQLKRAPSIRKVLFSDLFVIYRNHAFR